MARLHVVSILVFLVVILPPTNIWAHSGGTDKYGCHRETATNTRHCHHDSDGPTRKVKVNVIPSAAAGLQVAKGFTFDGDSAAFIGTASTYDDGSVSLLTGVAVYLSLHTVDLFLGHEIGVAFLGQEAYLSYRLSGGLRTELSSIGKSGSLFGSLVLFVDFIRDENNAEPGGLAAILGYQF